VASALLLSVHDALGLLWLRWLLRWVPLADEAFVWAAVWAHTPHCGAWIVRERAVRWLQGHLGVLLRLQRWRDDKLAMLLQALVSGVGAYIHVTWTRTYEYTSRFHIPPRTVRNSPIHPTYGGG
jgi:hypothetical protein